MSQAATVILRETKKYYIIYVEYEPEGEEPSAKIVACLRKDKYSEDTVFRMLEKIKTIFKKHFEPQA